MSAVLMLAGFAGLLGGAVGSFLNVVVYRVPLGRSVVSPGSACPGCGTPIRAADNVPVLSWLLLRGRCRSCTLPISVRYPLVELGTALFFAAVVAQFLPQLFRGAGSEVAASALSLGAFMYLASVSVALALIDVDVRRLPDSLVLPMIPVGALLLGAASLVDLHPDALLRGAVGAAAQLLLYLALALVRPGGMGMGDVKLAAGLGFFLAWLGWPTLIVGAFAAFLVGGAVGAVLLITKRATRTSAIPFGPFMLGGAWIAIFFGPSVWSSYLTIAGLS